MRKIKRDKRGPIKSIRRREAMSATENRATEESASSRRVFEEMTDLPLLRQYQKAFTKATGVSFNLIPPDAKHLCCPSGSSKDSLCSLLSHTPVGCTECEKTQNNVKQKIGRKLSPQKNSCFAGLTEVAVPILKGNRHIGTLMSGQIFRQERSKLDFEMLVKRIGGGTDNGWKEKARKAYFKIPVIPMERFQAVAELLNVFAKHLPDDANRHSLASSTLEPVAVSDAKKFVRSHYDHSITLEQVLQHVHVSRFHFCKIFKKATGMTLTEYTARIRVEKAKSLLLEPSLRISDVVFASGFGSVPQFNTVFKRLVGMSPTGYRRSLRSK